LKTNSISWVLDDESLLPAVRELDEQVDTRRAYRVIKSGDKAIFAKYFIEKGLWGFIRNRVDPRGRREYQTGKRLASFSIPTPKPLGYGIGSHGSFALQEWMDGTPFRSAFADPALRSRLLTDLAHLLESLRAAGVRHNDLHLDNILVKDGKLYVIDLHKAEVRSAALTTADSFVNLLHALGPVYRGLGEEERASFFRLCGTPNIGPALENKLAAEEVRWVERKKARAFSTTSKLTRVGRRVYVAGADRLGEGTFIECLKRDRKVLVDRYSDHIRKTYKNRRRLKKAWRNHVVLEYMGLSVSPATLYLERPTLLHSGFIAMEDLRGRGEELDRFLDRKYDLMNGVQRRGFLYSFSHFLATILKNGIIHGDVKACNIFALGDGFRLLDIEDLVFRPFKDQDLIRMLVQLNTTVPGRITSSDRLRFYFKLMDRLGVGRAQKKMFLYEVVKASSQEAIVYEGVDGLKIESWTDFHR
jgi:tRNA A-37 threonylcarbamoyl transferase component Bud32